VPSIGEMAPSDRVVDDLRLMLPRDSHREFAQVQRRVSHYFGLRTASAARPNNLRQTCRVDSYGVSPEVTLTCIFRGLAYSALGMVSTSNPLRYAASTLDASTDAARRNERRNFAGP
jgi:hypothetical protein